MKKIIASAFTSLSLAFPLIAGAQTLQNINDVADKAVNIGNLITGLAISVAVLWIIVNVVIYLIATNDPEKRAQGGKGILFGVIGLFVILSIWGLVYILKSSFRTNDQTPVNDIYRTTTLLPARRVDGGGTAPSRYVDTTSSLPY